MRIVTTPFSFEGKIRNEQAQKGIENLRVVKGLQTITRDRLRNHNFLTEHPDYEAIKHQWTELDNLTMHVSLGMYLGTTFAKGKYVVCQHNDFYYHDSFFKRFINLLSYYRAIIFPIMGDKLY